MLIIVTASAEGTELSGGMQRGAMGIGMAGGLQLLDQEEGYPVTVGRPDGASPVVIVCEHASNTMPRALGTLGLGPDALASHIAWDPGALAVAEILSDLFDAPLVRQRFSRLAYDCNRPPDAPDAIPVRSEIYSVPGNAGLDAAARRMRAEALYQPFHEALETVIAKRLETGISPVIVTVHSFTPYFFGKPRDGHLGILHDSDRRLADALFAVHGGEDFEVRRNWPYGPQDGVTHTLKRHGIANGFLNVMLEVRNDLIATPTGQVAWGERLAGLLGAALRMIAKGKEGRSVA